MSFLPLYDLPTVRPASPAELGDIVRHAAARGEAIYPLGGRTMLDLGLPPTKPGIGVNLTALDQVIDYPARDMTITVQAGITLAQLQQVLATENQWLPIDVPLPDKATLGGAIACNVSGPRRYGYGTFRDYVIGITVVNDRGQEVKAGGRVVKNVAGYDLCKLYTGSLGTLGVITQVTLKVRPKPEAQAMVQVSCARDVLADLLDRFHASATRPVCVDPHDEPGNTAPVRVFVVYEENGAAVDWQVNRLREELESAFPSLVVHRDASAEREFRILTETLLWSAYRLTFRANLLASALPRFIQAASEFAPQLATLHGQAGNGIVTGHFRESATKPQAKKVVDHLRAKAVAADGNLILTRCPDQWKHELGVWGEPRADWELMRTIKRQLDPQNLFNPGRFVGGI